MGGGVDAGCCYDGAIFPKLAFSSNKKCRVFMNEAIRILIVDDDEVLRTRLSRAFAARGYLVCIASNYDEAMELVRTELIDWAVMDLKMPGKLGLELLRDVKKERPNIEVVMLTGYGSIANAVEAVKLGALNYVPKPADADQILLAFGEDLEATKEADFQTPSLAEAEWDHIQRVLTDCHGNISEAARLLGIPRRTLQRKLKKMAP
jgi:two-component system, response regulator RegA